MSNTKIEILYDDKTSVVIDALDLDTIQNTTKTGILAIALWEPVDGKRIPLTYEAESDHYIIIVQVSHGIIVLDSFNDNDKKWFQAGNPQGGNGYKSGPIPPFWFNLESDGARKFYFIGSQVDGSVWKATDKVRDAMQKRTRDV